MDPKTAVEHLAREAHGRLLAAVASRTRDLAGAEDALAEAYAAALRQWPDEGVPNQPEAWLVQVARRRLIDQIRRENVAAAHQPELQRRAELEQSAVLDQLGEMNEFPDECLKLFFVCAHPAIEGNARTALILQVVSGWNAEQIAPLFLVTPQAMSQRLVRAKKKIRAAGIPFEVPGRERWSERLPCVLEAVYAACTVAYKLPETAGAMAEPLELAGLLARLLPGEPEALGLLALILHCEARRGARRDGEGVFIPLSQQDTGNWDREMIIKGNALLDRAVGEASPGRFQLEAAIQSAHNSRIFSGETPLQAVLDLYLQLLALAPTAGAVTGYAAALLEAGRPADALRQLEEIPAELIRDFQPYWATLAHVLHRLEEHEAARDAVARAMELAVDRGELRYLRDFLSGFPDSMPNYP